MVESINIDLSDSQVRCRKLFGSNFFGIPEVVGSYGYSFSSHEIEERKPVRILGHDGSLLSEVQSWDAIRRCHDEAPEQFVLCAGVQHSVYDVNAKHTDVFHPDLRSNPWFGENDHRQWSERKLFDYWFLLAKDVITDKWDKTSSAQEEWMKKTHPCRRFAQPEHLVFGSVLCYRATQGKLQLYSGAPWGRTLQRTAYGALVYVGFHPHGLYVNCWYDGAGWNCRVPSLWTSF